MGKNTLMFGQRNYLNPMRMVCAGTTGFFLNFILYFSSLFVLQLACILSMSSKWRNAVLRVFICVNSLQDMHFQEVQLKNLLEQLRIKVFF